jgi:two-component system phosphate regulon sensor histidine kinase PhoR
MYWVWLRTLLLLLVLVAGSLLGQELLGNWRGIPTGSLLGAALAALAAGVWDGLLGARSLRWLSSNHVKDAPRLPGMWGEVMARSERAIRQRDRRIEQEHARLAEFLEAIEASPNGVVLLGEAEEVLWCNRTAAHHLGLDPVRDRLQRVTNLVRAPAFVAQLHSNVTEPPAVLIPGRFGQGMLSVHLRAYGSEGQRLLLTQDVSEREQADAMRRDFVANVSHEIRTPLTVLAGFVETMASVPLGPEDVRRVLGLMTQQTRRMQNLVGDLLTLARLEGNPTPPLDSWVVLSDLGGLLEQDAVALSAGRHRLSFQWGDGWSLAGAEGEMQSAVANLLSNAVRYTPDGGAIDLRVSAYAGGLCLEVRDTGPGIATHHLPRLSERFYRVDGSRSRETGGTGLGLAIVKHVMLRHGGELRIQSEVGKGSCFCLQFPAARCRQHQDHRLRPPEPSGR